MQLINAKYPQPEQRQQFFTTLRTRLQSIQGISGAALASAMPLGGGGRFRFEVEGRPQSDPKTRPQVSLVEISPGYFDVSGIRLQAGRDFDERDGAPGGEVAIINKRLATVFFANEDPIGRRVRIFTGEQDDKPGAWFTVVGVSPTVRQGDVQALEPDAVLYQPYRVNSSTNTGILMRTSGEPSSVIPAVREVVRSIDPEQPVYALQPLDTLVAGARYPYVVFGSLFVIFAVIALVLSAVGIYAIMAYSVTQRTQEIGVRLALGASPRQITWLILRGGLIQLAIGLVLGLMGAFGVTKLLASLVVQIPAADPVTFVAITTLMTIVTLAACLIPSRRATRLDPLTALRID
jgi:putative ABC transport system permease protein